MTLRSRAATGVASSTGVPARLRQDRWPERACEPHPPRPFGHDELGVITVALAVCLLFDRRSERAIRALWDQLESLGVPSLRSHTHGRHVPHLSYAVLRSWDLASVTAALSGLDAGRPVDLSFDGIGLFRRGRARLPHCSLAPRAPLAQLPGLAS